MAQTTFYPNTGGDGSVDNQNASWATCRAATVALYKYDTATTSYISSWWNGAVYVINRAFLPFDTSSIPDTDTIESAELKVYIQSFHVQHTGGAIGVVQNTQASSTVLALEDFDQVGSTEGAARQTPASVGWLTFSFNATGVGWISKTGYTKLAVRTALDLDNTTPVDGVSETATTYYTAEQTTYKPQLIVTHWGPNRYWVGKNGTTSNWSDRNNWSDSSGGTGGAPVPTSANNVYFDANSFSASKKTVTIDTDATCGNMVWTGATNTPVVAGSSALSVYGELTTIAAMTWTHSGILSFLGAITWNFTTNAIAFACSLVIDDDTFITLQDATTFAGTITLTSGGLNTNNVAVSCAGFISANTNTRTLTLGSSAFACAGTWDLSMVTNLTLNANTSTITISGTSVSFKGGGKTYNNLTLTATAVTITGSNTFATLTLTAGKTVNVTAGTTQTVTSLVATGSAGNIITLRSTVAGSVFTIADTAGTNTCNFLDIKDCTASGGATFIAGDSSVDSGNNTGWTNPWTNPGNVYSSNNVYATHTATDGDIYVQLSKDGGTTWQTALLKTFTGVEGEQTYGNGATELWGTSWLGSDVADASFKLRIISQAADSFNTQVYGSFGFDGEIAADRIVEGIEVKIEAKWDGTTTSVDAISVRVYSSGSSVPVVAGSFAYDTTLARPTFYNGSAWKKLISEDDAATTSASGIVELATDAETTTGTDTTRAVTPSNLAALVASPAGKKFIGCRLYSSSHNNITTGTWTNVAFNSETIDTNGFHDTVTNSQRITIPTGYGGKYRLHATLTWDSNATGFRVCRIDLNATPTILAYGDSVNACNGNNTVIQAETIVTLAAGDYVALSGFHNKGSDLAPTAGENSTFFEAEYLGV